MAYGYSVRSFRPTSRPTGQALSNARRGTVAVGTQTRAYREGQRGAGSVAVGANTRYAREHPVGGQQPGGAPGIPPPSSPQSLFAKLPPSRYNPERNTLAEESQQGFEQLAGRLGTTLSRNQADYTTDLASLEQQRGYGTANHNESLSKLAEAFRRLGVTQQERQNQAGVLPGGGAALQAAAKRLGNEGKERDLENTRYGREQTGFNDQAAKLNQSLERGEQDFNTELGNAAFNNTEYQRRQEGLAGTEAANNGYYEPEPAGKPGPARHPSVRQHPAHVGRRALAAGRAKARF